jgi:glycosyltransferase involved in cell wall biosynthesis
MDAPLISVILCFLNPGCWLDEAVDSVIAQTYPNWELILVDDGSVVSDGDRAKRFALAFPTRVKYTDHANHRNIGLTASRNVGISLAKGSFVAFLDADDYWYPGKLAHQLSLFERFPGIGMICEASRFWYSWNDVRKENPVIEIGVPEGLYFPRELIKVLYPLHTGQPPCPSGIILRSAIFKDAGAFEEAFSGIYQLYEDQAFLAKMYLTQTIYISATANNKYRKHQHSMSGAASDANLYAKVRNYYLDWLTDYLEKQKIEDAGIWSLIRAARLTVADGDRV